VFHSAPRFTQLELEASNPKPGTVNPKRQTRNLTPNLQTRLQIGAPNQVAAQCQLEPDRLTAWYQGVNPESRVTPITGLRRSVSLTLKSRNPKPRNPELENLEPENRKTQTRSPDPPKTRTPENYRVCSSKPEPPKPETSKP